MCDSAIVPELPEFTAMFEATATKISTKRTASLRPLIQCRHHRPNARTVLAAKTAAIQRAHAPGADWKSRTQLLLEIFARARLCLGALQVFVSTVNATMPKSVHWSASTNIVSNWVTTRRFNGRGLLQRQRARGGKDSKNQKMSLGVCMDPTLDFLCPEEVFQTTPATLKWSTTPKTCKAVPKAAASLWIVTLALAWFA